MTAVCSVTTLVDSNVILDVVTEDRTGWDWSASMLAPRGAARPAGHQSTDLRRSRVRVREHRGSGSLRSRPSTSPARHYHGRLGSSQPGCFSPIAVVAAAVRAPLPDFFIGAHAARWAGSTLLPRDRRRYKTYFRSCASSNRSNHRRTTIPSFITNDTCSITLTSLSGSPGTATRSPSCSYRRAGDQEEISS